MADPVTGPYEVVAQRPSSSVVLKDPETGELVEGGTNIPVEQILAGPRRPALQFGEPSELRSVGAMVRGEGSGGDLTRPGRRAGWGHLAPGGYVAYQTVPQGPKAKDLTVGKVQANDRDGQTVLVQPHRARWLYVKITHELLYQGREGLQTKPGGREAVDTVRYEALV